MVIDIFSKIVKYSEIAEYANKYYMYYVDRICFHKNKKMFFLTKNCASVEYIYLHLKRNSTFQNKRMFIKHGSEILLWSWNK